MSYRLSFSIETPLLIMNTYDIEHLHKSLEKLNNDVDNNINTQSLEKLLSDTNIYIKWHIDKQYIGNSQIILNKCIKLHNIILNKIEHQKSANEKINLLGNSTVYSEMSTIKNIRDSILISNDSIKIADDTIITIKKQGEQIDNFNYDLNNIDDNIKESSSLLKKIWINIITDKVIKISIIVILMIVLVIVIMFKATKH